MYSLKRKLKFVITNPIQTKKIPVTIDNIRAVKVRWLYYRTATDGEKDMQIRIQEIDDSGMYVKDNGANARYLLAIPLDQNSAVTLTYSNYMSEMDAEFRVPINTINELNFEILINDVIANQVSPSNPVVMEMAFYN